MGLLVRKPGLLCPPGIGKAGPFTLTFRVALIVHGINTKERLVDLRDARAPT
jgi:hypothetical protein